MIIERSSIGINPEVGDKENKKSLAVILTKFGYGLPGLSGITRQTIAGFISTGTAGGSLFYSLYDAVVGIRLIDGKGGIHSISKNDPNFYAAGISFGLFGIITSVEISLTTNSYYIKGSETISPVAPPSSDLSKGCPIDIFGNGSQQYPSLTKFFETGADYSRLFWYTQKGFNRVAVWKASRYDQKPFPRIKPYQLFPGKNFTARSINVAAALAELNSMAANSQEYYALTYSILSQFLPIGKQNFFDIYHNSLPMDNYLSYKILPLTLCEFFIPFDKAKEVVNTLKNYFSTHGVGASSNTAFEVYTGVKSPFWLSPTQNIDVVRVGWYWYQYNPNGTAANFFRQFSKLLKPFEYRYHWGKYIPDDYNGQRLHKLYPKLKAWLKIRDQMDPKQIFVTPYWRKMFSIKHRPSTS